MESLARYQFVGTSARKRRAQLGSKLKEGDKLRRRHSDSRNGIRAPFLPLLPFFFINFPPLDRSSFSTITEQQPGFLQQQQKDNAITI